MSIAKEIRWLRSKLGMNQSQFAAAVGVSQGSVSKWEAGRESPRLEAMDRIRELSESLNTYPPNIGEGTFAERFPVREVRIVGQAVEGEISARWSHEDEIPLMLPIAGDMTADPLEAWIIEGRFPDFDLSFVALFRSLHPGASLSEYKYHTAFLVAVSVADGDGHIFALMELMGSKVNGLSLWPLSDEARRRNLFVLLDEDGRCPEGIIPVGELISTIERDTRWKRIRG